MRIPGNCIAQTAACFSILKKSTQVPVSMAAYGEPANGVNRSENQCSSISMYSKRGIHKISDLKLREDLSGDLRVSVAPSRVLEDRTSAVKS